MSKLLSASSRPSYRVSLIAGEGLMFDVPAIREGNCLDYRELETMVVLHGGEVIRWWTPIDYDLSTEDYATIFKDVLIPMEKNDDQA